MARGSNASHVCRSGALGLALMLTAAACGSDTDRAESAAPQAASATPAHQGPPTGTLAPLVAPSRSYKPVFLGEAGAVERAFRARLDAFERKDVDAAVALYSGTEVSRAEVLAFMNNYVVRLYRINDIAVNGKRATVDYENAIVGRDLKSRVTTLLAQHEVWTKKDGRWKGVSDESSAPGIPEDLTTVTVTLRDDAQTIVPTPLPKSDFAFLLQNTGAGAKGVMILGLRADLEVAALIPQILAVAAKRGADVAAHFPDGTLEMGATPDIAAHDSGTMVFTARLPKGRYLLLSSSTGDDGFVLPREYAEFTVE